MKLERLVEMIRQDYSGAEEWPVFFTCVKLSSTGEVQEVEDARAPIEAVKVEETSEEVLLIMNSDCQPLSVGSLERKLTDLMPGHGEFLVDCCETPIETDEGLLHLDFPIAGVRRADADRCFLLAAVQSEQHQGARPE